MPPTFGNGKICYIEIPSLDIAKSADFYQKVFGWTVRKRADGSVAFDDGVGEVSGSWVLGRSPALEPGFAISLMVDDAVATLEAIAASGCEIVHPIDKNAPEITATFRDPGGNVVGIYQHKRRS